MAGRVSAVGEAADFATALLVVDIDAGGITLELGDVQVTEVEVGCRVVGSGLGGGVWRHKPRLDQLLLHLEDTRLLLWQIWRETWRSAGQG